MLKGVEGGRGDGTSLWFGAKGGHRYKCNVILKVLRGLKTVKRWHSFDPFPGIFELICILEKALFAHVWPSST